MIRLLFTWSCAPLAGLLLAAVAVGPSADAAPPDGFRPLFNDKDLDGWYGKVSSNPAEFAKLRKMIAKAKADVEAQIAPDSKGAKDVLARYPKAQVRKFDGDTRPDAVPTELDAVIAYLQMLGTLVDFSKYDASGPNLR